MTAPCRNAFCIATDGDGVNHYDYTGFSWEQREGTAYNPATGEYDLPEDVIVNGVLTDYRRH